MIKLKKYCKIRKYCAFIREYRGTTHITCILKYSLTTKIPILFCNGSNYDYHFYQKQVSRKTGKIIYL